ncbi:2492_t:CDS:2, partial [Cetraspora pellucida]
MIKSVLIFNNHGKPRITKFYQQIDIGTQQALLQEIYSLVSKRPDTACNFLEGSQMLGGKDTRIIYRHYATLYFVFVVDESESELGILDLIQVFVESLDRCFENVCELDLIFHFEEVHHILSEVVSGGMVLETNISEIVSAYNEANKLKKRSGTIATISTSGAGAVARDLGANFANTVTSTLQNTLQTTVNATFPTFRR